VYPESAQAASRHADEVRIAFDGDVDMRNDYASRERTLRVVNVFPLDYNVQAAVYKDSGELRPLHGVGLSVLLAPAVGLGGLTGARLLMVLIAALLAHQLYRLLAELEQQYGERQLILGVERLDYTKGIPHKLQAYERFLERDPERARTTTMIQVLVPSRLESPEYRAQRDEIELRIARINGRFGQPGSTPVEYINRDISKPALVALYRRADVMMVTALRDGMNLVAHEFVLCQSEPGLPGRWRGSLGGSTCTSSRTIRSCTTPTCRCGARSRPRGSTSISVGQARTAYCCQVCSSGSSRIWSGTTISLCRLALTSAA
jgi:hypothetical protein